MFVVLVFMSGCSLIKSKEDLPPIVSDGVNDFCEKVDINDIERLITFICLTKEF